MTHEPTMLESGRPIFDMHATYREIMVNYLKLVFGATKILQNGSRMVLNNYSVFRIQYIHDSMLTK